MPATGHGGLAAKSWPHILNFDFANNNDAEVYSGLAVNLDYFSLKLRPSDIYNFTLIPMLNFDIHPKRLTYCTGRQK